MGNGGHYETKAYHAGKIGEKVKYFVPASREKPRSKSSEEKIASNASGVTRRVARCLNENFKKGDTFVTLTFNEAGYARVLTRAQGLDQTLDEGNRIFIAAQYELKLLFDRSRPALRKQGIELKYIAVVSDMDGDTGESVRVHVHMVVPKDCAPVILEKWAALGDDAKSRKLRGMDDYTPLAEYLMKQVRHIPNVKKYLPSRNLMRSEPTARKVMSGAQLRPPKGCKLLYAAPYTGERDCQYIRYLLPPERWTGVWKKKPKRSGGSGGPPGKRSKTPDKEQARRE